MEKHQKKLYKNHHQLAKQEKRNKKEFFAKNAGFFLVDMETELVCELVPTSICA